MIGRILEQFASVILLREILHYPWKKVCTQVYLQQTKNDASLIFPEDQIISLEHEHIVNTESAAPSDEV